MAEGMDMLRATFSRTSVKTEVCDQLHTFQQSGHFCDVNILVHGHAIPAHRAVLAASSQYFRRMFEGGFRESKEAIIDLSESVGSVDTLNTALRFIYTGDLEITSDTLTDILGASSLLMLEHLIGFCGDFMVNHLEPSNCLRTWALADVFNLKDVCDVCQTMARCRFRDHIQYLPDVLDLPGVFLKKIVNKGVMDFLDPNEIGTLLLQWFQRDNRERYSACKEVIKLIEQQQQLSSFIDSKCGSKISIVDNCEELRTYLYALSTFKEVTVGEPILNVVASKCSRGGNSPSKNTYSLYVYSPHQDKWYSKDIAMPDDITYSFIGATKECLVFQKKSGNITIGLCQDQSIEWIEGSSDVAPDVDVAYHVWEGNLVMIRGYTGGTTEYITVFCYDFETRSWRIMGKPCSIDLVSESMHTAISQLNCYTYRDTLYLIITTKDGHISLMKLKHGCKDWQLFKLHRLPRLKGPPAQRKYDEFEITSNNEEVVLKIGNNVMIGCLEKNNEYNQFRLYTGEPLECWPRSVPPKAWHGCQNAGYQVVRVDTDLAAPWGTTGWHRQGYVFMDVVGEYLTKCWRGIGDPLEPRSFIWLEVTPMPAETLHSFSTCEVHGSILQYFNKPTFKCKKENGGTIT